MPQESSTFSWPIFLSLLLVCGVSLLMFLLLVRRWTTQRQWVSLAEWARDRGFRFRSREIATLPAALEPLKASNVRFRLHLCDKDMTIAQLETDPIAGEIEPNRWNVVVRKRAVTYPASAGLRPAAAPASMLDLMGLSQFPNLAIGQRFMVLGSSSAAARRVADSASRTLLPADIGLLIIDDWVVLDFSTRPFDPIELDRMIALGAQLSEMLNP